MSEELNQGGLSALAAELERVKKNHGCARHQGSTQFCAEAVTLQAENARLRDASKDAAKRLRDYYFSRPVVTPPNDEWFEGMAAAVFEKEIPDESKQ